MLYTSYLAKLNKLPEDMEKVIITRFPPKWLNMDKYKNLWLMKELSPSQELLLRYKQDNNWDNYIRDFTYEMKNREDMNKIVIFNDYKTQKDEKSKENLRQKYQDEDDSENGFGIDFDNPEMQEFIREQEEYGEFEAFYEQKHYKEIQKEYEIWRKENGYE